MTRYYKLYKKELVKQAKLVKSVYLNTGNNKKMNHKILKHH